MFAAPVSSAAPFVPPDQPHRDRAQDPGRNVVLRASAGTGKTRALTDRYLRLLECGARPRNILALTFTREAAREMKDRIFTKLKGPEARRRIGGSAPLAEVTISTIDAFTLGLIREFPLDAGVTPGARILDERAMPAVMQQAIDRVLSGRTGFDRGLLGELPLLLDKRPGTVGGMARRYLDKRLVWRPRFQEKAQAIARSGAAPAPTLAAALRPAAAACRRLAAAEGSDAIPLPVRIALSHVVADLRAGRPGACSALDVDTLTRWCRLDIRTVPRGFPKAWKRDYRAVKNCIRAFRPRWQRALNDRALPRVWRVFQAVEREYQRLKQERGVMDFDDLTETAIRLLREMGEFSDSRFRLESRYHHLLIDEFHDTSDAQWTLLRAIVEPWKSGAGLAAEEVVRTTGGRLSRPTIFVVGDPKQSIYRFRDARVEILSQAETLIAELAGADAGPRRRKPTLHLKFNFRSNRRLRRFVNRASRRIAAAPGGAAPGEAWAFRYEGADHFPEDPNPNHAEPGPDEPVLSVAVDRDHARVAERVAERVHLLLAEDRGDEREDRFGRRAAAAPEDIAILARANGRLGIYQRALEDRGIAAFALRGAGFFDAPEIRDLRAVLRFLGRPWSDLRAVEALRSRFFAVAGESLAELRRLGTSASPFADLLREGPGALPEGLAPAHADPLRMAAATTKEWVALASSLPPVRAVARILETFGYVERLRAGSGGAAFAGEQGAANIGKALRLLRAFERQGFATMERMAERFEGAAADGDSTAEPIQAAGAVQLLSIHAAKGLEYDHVFLVDCAAKTPPTTGIPRVVEHGTGRWSIALVDDAPGWKADDGGRGDAEERRCLYVAMTRARRSLSLSWVGMAGRYPLKKPRGLATYLPPSLFRDAMATLPGVDGDGGATGPIGWENETIEVLPPVASDPDAPAAAG